MCTLKMSESPKSLLFSLLFILLFNERAGMRRRSRGRKPVASRLHRYGLQEREGVSMQATSDAHVGASLRVSRKDLLRLEGRKAGRACEEGPIVAPHSALYSQQTLKYNVHLACTRKRLCLHARTPNDQMFTRPLPVCFCPLTSLPTVERGAAEGDGFG